MSVACGDPQGDARSGEPTTPHQDGEEAFLTALAEVPDRPYTVYWLGKDPVINGEALFGPAFVTVGTANSRASFQYKYYGSRPGLGVSLIAFTPNAWKEIERPTLVDSKPDSSRAFSIDGGGGTLYSFQDGRVLIAVVEIGETVMRVSTTARLGNDPAVYSLAEPETFIRLIQENLRPYPD